MKSSKYLPFCCLILLASLASPLSAQSSESQSSESAEPSDSIAGSIIFRRPETVDSRFFTLTVENDAFVGEDDGFTNGLGLTYGRGPFTSFSPDNIPGVLHWLAKKTYINRPNKIKGIAYNLGQFIQTPKDITIAEPQPNDIPWAGLLSLQTTLYSWDRNASDQLSFSVGVVGPLAFADEAQTFVHEIIGSDEPLGWDNQLDNELVISVSAVRNQKLFTRYGSKYGFDVIGLGQAGAGTIISSVGGGLAARFGTNMKFSHATFDLLPDRQVNSLSLAPSNDFYTYIGASAKYVFNDVLIDGNTFEDSASAPLENAQNLATLGFVAKYGRFAYVFQLSSFSSRSEFSSDREKLGAFSLSVAF